MQTSDTLGNDVNANVAISITDQPEYRKRSKRASMSHVGSRRASIGESGRLCRRASLDVNAPMTSSDVNVPGKMSRRASINDPVKGKVYRRASLNNPGRCSTFRRYSCTMGTEQSFDSETKDHDLFVRKKLIPTKYDRTDCEMMEKEYAKLKYEKANLFAGVDCLVFKKKQKDLKLKQAKKRIEELRLARNKLMNNMAISSLCNEKLEEDLSSMKYEYEKDLQAHRKVKLEYDIMRTKSNHIESLANELRRKHDETELRIAKIKQDSIDMNSEIAIMLYEKNKLATKNMNLREKLEIIISDIHVLCRKDCLEETNLSDPTVVAANGNQTYGKMNVEKFDYNVETSKKQKIFSLDEKVTCHYSKAA